MPVIPEEADTMDQFVNWDQAGSATAMPADPDVAPFTSSMDSLNDIDLALANVDGDDFSFWALQHFENSNFGVIDPTLDAFDMDLSLDASPKAFEDSFDIPDAPCAHCQTGSYHCKRIREGKYKGYCTSCVALRCACSFGLSDPTPYPTDSAFPHNPWPVMGDHPDAITQEDVLHDMLPVVSTSEPASLTLLAGPDNSDGNNIANVGRKAGARFSRESVKILKNWLSTHSKHPYPNDEEKKMLQKQTGLDKTQITNWLANARRRKKIVAPRSTSPGVRTWANAIDIPQRRGTPASFEHMNPLQRWQNSPPENEPASVTAIARAVSTASNISSGLNSPYSLNFTDDGSGRSQCALSSASSLDTSFSGSGHSFASAYSHASRGSLGSFNSMDRGRRRRRRKAAARKPDAKTPLTAPLKSFQCTFCTDTFRTKHDWQRHEKSLHLSLERWVCTPDGPRAFNPENGQVSCVFCGEANPSEQHIEGHNHSACQERTLGERTFYRKDHLRQHLKLVHGGKFVSWSMEQWKVATPEIRSRCGFCGIVMDTWTIRVDHLAEHFKTGNTMADWKGDWGFDLPVLDMVENSIPPYLIHDERNSPYPYAATQGSPETARNAYELLKSELLFYLSNEREVKGTLPTDDDIRVEACRILFGAEVLSKQGSDATSSWLRDLVLSSEEHAMKARLAPIRGPRDSRQAKLEINGKENIFEDDSMETELHEYVKARRLLGLTAMDHELQVEACNIISRMEEQSSHPSDDVANFLLRLIYGNTKWLTGFRQRAVLPRSEDIPDEANRSKDPTTIDSTIHNYSRLESELAEYVRSQRSLGVEPSDADLQRQARIIIYEFDDAWNQTAADNAAWLRAFKKRHASEESSAAALASKEPLTIAAATRYEKMICTTSPSGCPLVVARSRNSSASSGSGSGSGSPGASSTKIGPYFFNDANCYRRLARELGRFVQSTMSPNNPNRHIPTDEELQHQARWILYDDDDPWNQTAADNAEWLRRFKREVGILKDPSLPGLPQGLQWSIAQGGSGFAPPYVFPNPKAPLAPLGTDDSMLAITVREGAKPIPAEGSTATKYLQAFGTRHQPPATVFCSRELENGLAEFVTTEVQVKSGQFPNDEAIKARARDILKTPSTPADDEVLLDKFKGMMKRRLGVIPEEPEEDGFDFLTAAGMDLDIPSQGLGITSADQGLDMTAFGQGADMTFTEGELNDILNDIGFDFGDMGALTAAAPATTMG